MCCSATPRAVLDFLSQSIDDSSEVFKFIPIIGSPDGLQHTPASRSVQSILPKGFHSSPLARSRFLSASNAKSPDGGIGSYSAKKNVGVSPGVPLRVVLT